jgi:hypothetical protein
MTATYAVVTVQSAWLSTDFGESYARKIFGDEFVDQLPRYVRGKRKGLIKGKIEWLRVESGGWYRKGPGYRNGMVVRPNQRFGHHIVSNESIWGGSYK